MPRSWGPYDGGASLKGHPGSASTGPDTDPPGRGSTGADAEPTTHELMKDRLCYERFLRTLTPTTSRRGRTAKMPPHLAAEMTDSKGKKKRWFHIWVVNGCCWDKVMGNLGIEAPEGAEEGADEWATLQELEDFYKDKGVAKAIADSKRILGH